MKFNIYLSNEIGFCFGVKRAIKKAEELSDKLKKPIYTLGELVHNELVNKELTKKQIYSIDLQEAVDNNISNIIIRSHGVSKEVIKILEENNIRICDATCPCVKKIHTLARKYYDNGYKIIIIGNPNHPEVIGINGWVNNDAIILNTEEDANRLTKSDDKTAIFFQTTLTIKHVNVILSVVESKISDILCYDTICQSTKNRQSMAEYLSKFCDLMIVIGDKNSSNTQKLYELCKKTTKAIHVQSHKQINDNIKMIEQFNNIGVVTGASTSDEITNKILDKLFDLGGKLIMEQDNKQVNPMVELLDEYSGSLGIRKGKVLDATIEHIGSDEIIFNINYKSDGILPKEELFGDEVAVGDVLKVMVANTNDGSGNVLLSRKRLIDDELWVELEEAFEEKRTINVTVTKVVKGGLEVRYKSLRGFIPASKVDVRFHENLQEFVGKELEVRVSDVNRKNRNLILTRKDLLEEVIKEEREKFLSTIEVDQTLKGTVKSILDFGAFISLGPVDGFVHKTELTYGRINHPSEVFNVGDEVEVYITKINDETQKVYLSLKKLSVDPWAVVSERYVPGEIYLARMISVTDFGIFAELEPGVEGLIHISKISRDHTEKASDEFENGKLVNVKVLDIDFENKRISLSIKDTLELPAEEEKSDVQHEDNEQDNDEEHIDYSAHTDNEESDAPLLNDDIDLNM